MANGQVPEDGWVNKAARSSAALVWSRIASGIFLPIATVFGLFAWNTLVEVKEYVTKNDTAIRLIEQRVSELEKDAAAVGLTRYKDSDAARDFRARDQKDAEQDRRLEALEQRKN